MYSLEFPNVVLNKPVSTCIKPRFPKVQLTYCKLNFILRTRNSGLSEVLPWFEPRRKVVEYTVWTSWFASLSRMFSTCGWWWRLSTYTSVITPIWWPNRLNVTSLLRKQHLDKTSQESEGINWINIKNVISIKNMLWCTIVLKTIFN